MALKPIFENGKEIMVNEEFHEALIKQNPKVYSLEVSKSAPEKESQKPVGENKPESQAPNLNDGKFSREDLSQLKFDQLKEIAVKFEIPTSKKSKIVLADEIWEKIKPKE